MLEKGYDVHGTIRRSSTDYRERIAHLEGTPNFHLHYADLGDSMSIIQVMNKVTPTEVYNLAAQSHVQVSFDSPEFTADVDATGVLRILEAIRQCGLEKTCRMYQASTSELYGKVEEVPQNENTPFHPYSPYAVAKQYGFWIVKEYREAYDMFCCSGILFNHESERRGETFVTRKITLAAARIKQGKQDKLYLGNLDSLRDWGYAKDYVECMLKQLIKKSISQKTLFTDVFGYSLTKTGFADKYLAGQLTMYKSYSWLKKHFENDLKQIKAELPKEQNCEAAEKQVWICWLQGMENAPQIVQDCYASVCYWMKDWKITVITADNMNEYVQFPDYIVRKWKEGVISNTHLSDLLRLELLIRYGGLWIDSTTYMTGTIPAYIDDSNFFVYRNGWMDMEMINMGSWLIFSKYTNNIILLETQSLLYAYWKKYNYIKNYFLMHIFFRMVTDANPELWEQVPAINHIDSHLLMQELPKHYDENRCQQIMRLTPIHKLTYKVETSKGATAEKLGVLFQNRREQYDSIQRPWQSKDKRFDLVYHRCVSIDFNDKSICWTFKLNSDDFTVWSFFLQLL